VTAVSRSGHLNAIIVPAARPASALGGLIELAARLNIMIVALCSHQANVDQVAERIEKTTGARGIAIGLDRAYALPGQLTTATSSGSFVEANGGRASDLSVKRNIGLVLARMLGWHKIVFVDDDITLSAPDVERLADQLDNHQIAGMVCRDFPDNSVLCHARRLAKLPQDVFVTGAVLGVNCSDLPLPFFPDIYNEDWFFFAEAAAHHRLAKVGEARQAAYDPYDEERARHEEFGDLLAEGLYSLIEDDQGLVRSRRPGDFFHQLRARAGDKYWSTFIDVRRQDLQGTRERLTEFILRDSCSDDVFTAIKALDAADTLYDGDAITADRCVEFLDSWIVDLARWNTVYARTSSIGHTPDAMDWLQIKTWTEVRCPRGAVRSRVGGAARSRGAGT
jgi:hypothetical protein